MNRAAVNILAQEFVQTCLSVSLRETPTGGNAGYWIAVCLVL